ncbi:hypothetical protein [Methylobacter marinus]|uniref:hypothetical protein n=1 Tax=Methylobacter marinus TaxID=34058 RepID=UPI00058B943F|nr:hypothetical protein [Methylobacter marinus]
MKKPSRNRKAYRELAKSFTNSMFESGLITEDDIEDREKLFNRLITLARSIDYKVVVDHRDSLISEAKIKFEAKEYELAIMFYALYFEHAINSIIDAALTRNELCKKTKVAVLRNVDNSGKYTWLLEVLNLPPFNKKHSDIILKVASERNAFVHYKWNTDYQDVSVNELIQLIKSARQSVTYVKQYESRVNYKGKKGVLQSTNKANSAR